LAYIITRVNSIENYDMKERYLYKEILKAQNLNDQKVLERIRKINLKRKLLK